MATKGKLYGFERYYVKNFIYCVTHDGFGVCSPLYEHTASNTLIESLISETKRRLHTVKDFLSYKDVVDYYKSDKIEFLIQLVSYLEKIGPDIVCDTDSIRVIYLAKINDKFLNDLLE